MTARVPADHHVYVTVESAMIPNRFACKFQQIAIDQVKQKVVRMDGLAEP